MKTNYILLTFLVITSCSTLKNIPNDTDVALVWRGFEHSWQGEVHRVSRIGNWIDVSNSEFPKKVTINHSAQSGTNADVAKFSTYYDVLQAYYTKFVTGKATISIITQERKVKQFSQRVEIPVSSYAGLSGKDQVDVVLNGFDFDKKNFQTKKLGILELNIENVQHTSSSISFDVNGELMMSCESTECGIGEDLEYDLKVYYLIVASTPDNFKFYHHPVVSTNYDYDSNNPVPESLGTFDYKSLNTTYDPSFSTTANTLAIRGFRFNVSKLETLLAPDIVPHLFTWKMWLAYASVVSGTEPAVKGQAFFAHSNNGVTNIGHIGHVFMEIKPVSLLFKTGGIKAYCISDGSQSFGNDASGDNIHTITGEIKGLGVQSCIK